MPEMSERYLEILVQISGKNLVPETTNPLIRQYDEELKNLSIEEQRSDGKIFKASVCDIDNRRHELLDKDTLILSRQIKWNIHDPHPHNPNNAEHSIHVRLHRALMQLTVETGTPYDKKMTIKAIDSHAAGDFKRGRWPKDRLDAAF